MAERPDFPNAPAIAQLWISNLMAPEDAQADMDPAHSMYEIPQEKPELCYAVILEALKLLPPDTSNHAYQQLAAGPLEDLIAYHGSALIDRIELEARRNPNFNLLLGGVWQNDATPEVWKRVEAARLKVW